MFLLPLPCYCMEGESQIAPVEQIDYLRKEDLVVDGSIQEVAQ